MPSQSLAEAQDLKTCKLTLVMPGHSDKVIKVCPAEHESEKIWLDNTNGIARWEAVKRLLNQFAPRGEAVPEPVAYHEGKDLKTIIIAESDIPVVKLDGAVLKKPHEEKPVGESQVKLNPSVENLQLRMAAMEKTQEQILAAIQGLAQPPAATAAQAASRSAVLPKNETKTETGASCESCGKQVKNEHALKIHRGREHKQAK